jgi:hypothetical protein
MARKKLNQKSKQKKSSEWWIISQNEDIQKADKIAKERLVSEKMLEIF